LFLSSLQIDGLDIYLLDMALFFSPVSPRLALGALGSAGIGATGVGRASLALEVWCHSAQLRWLVEFGYCPTLRETDSGKIEKEWNLGIFLEAADERDNPRQRQGVGPAFLVLGKTTDTQAANE
jgi:hypothetical protein